MRKFLSIMLLIIFTYSTQTIAKPNLLKSNIAKKIIYQEIDSLDRHDWNTFISLQLDADQNDLKKFVSDNIKNNKSDGFLTINSAKVKEIKMLPIEAVAGFIDINSYTVKYGDVYPFLVGIDYKVKKQSKYFLNGVNYRIIIAGQENGKWKILIEMDAPLEDLVPKGYGFNSRAEKEWLKVLEARFKGIIIDLKGNVLDTNY